MSLKKQAQDSRVNDFLNLQIGESAILIVRLDSQAARVKKHKVGFKVFDCTGKGCPDCARGDNPPESWRLKVERESEQGEISDCTVIFHGFGYAQFGEALPDRETGKCRMRATGVGALNSDGEPVCSAKNGRQYVNLEWKHLED